MNNLNMKVEIFNDQGKVVEERRMPKCYPYQIPGLPSNVKKIRTVFIDQDGKEIPNTWMNLIIGSRVEVSNLLRAFGTGNAKIFEDNTKDDPETARYIVLDDLANPDTRRIDSK